jgi:hypothetical protein
MAYTTINKSTLYFNTQLYTGTGSSNAQTGVGFQPDWCWFKNRSTADGHRLVDAVRGATKEIYADNVSYAETTEAQGLKTFDSDGFTVGTASDYNGSGNNIVCWNWKANGQGSSNTEGSINTTYTSANTTSGFSIIKYTGNGSTGTIGHGLGVAPDMMLVRQTSSTSQNWYVYHSILGGTKYLHLNTTAAVGTASSVWNDTAPTSSLISLGTDTAQSGTYICYAFAGKTGFSKFGDYTGNGSADGTFVYTGFKPAYVLSKNTSSTQGWFLIDNKRANPYNPVDGSLHPNSGAAEDTSSDFFVDFVSNGFKVRDTDAQLNASGNVYIYMAFAEAPLVGSNNIPCVAR